MNVTLTSCLPQSAHEDLERLVFFNPNQLHSQADVLRALDLYGTPAIVVGPHGLHVTLSRCPDVQCLFATSGEELMGMLVYRRTSTEDVLVVHIAVADPYSRNRDGLSVVIRLLRAVRASARRLRGVQRLRVFYRDGRQFGIPINASADGTDRLGRHVQSRVPEDLNLPERVD